MTTRGDLAHLPTSGEGPVVGFARCWWKRVLVACRMVTDFSSPTLFPAIIGQPRLRGLTRVVELWNFRIEDHATGA